MAGLSDALTNKEVSSTTLPSWYSTAQQNLVNQATGVQAPAPGQTTLGSAVGAFGTSGPFATGQSTLETIGSGAANPWLVSPTGEVSPNVNTAMGGLFKAQTDYAKEMMPDIEAAATSPFIGSGGFGSRMNIGAAERAKGQFLSDLFQKQMTSALQNQQTGVSAGAALGNIGNQLVQGAINTATEQANLPYAGSVNQAKILQMLQQPQSTTKSSQLGVLNQLGALGALGSGAISALNDRYAVDAKGNVYPVKGILSNLGIKGGTAGLFSGLFKTGGSGITDAGAGQLPPGFETNAQGGTYDPESGMYWYNGTSGSYAQDASGNLYDSSGNIMYSPGWDNFTSGDSGLDTSGGDTSFMDDWGL